MYRLYKKILGKLGMIMAVMALFSCTERMDIDLYNTHSRCVIFGQISTDTTAHRVTITRSADYFSNKPSQGISNAEVKIFDGENYFVLSEDVEQPGNYYTEPAIFGIPGKIYTLLVDNVDLLGDGNITRYQASSELRPVADPDSIKVTYNPQWQGWIVQVYALDPAETHDFYKFLVYVNGDLHSDSLHNINYTSDDLFNGNYTNGVVVYYADGEDGFNVGDTITVGFCGITEDYYWYLNEVKTTSTPTIPLIGGSPANPRTNLNNEAVGYFTAYSISKASTIITSDEIDD